MILTDWAKVVLLDSFNIEERVLSIIFQLIINIILILIQLILSLISWILTNLMFQRGVWRVYFVHVLNEFLSLATIPAIQSIIRHSSWLIFRIRHLRNLITILNHIWLYLYKLHLTYITTLLHLLINIVSLNIDLLNWLYLRYLLDGNCVYLELVGLL